LPYTFITGGASSGKSSFALELFRNREDVTFIATGITTDPEMGKRIRDHRNQRPSAWETIEEPLDLIGAVKKAKSGSRALIIDCLTFWVSNLLYYKESEPQEILNKAQQISLLLKKTDRVILIVTNEVGMGIIPENEETRAYRKIAGGVNQIFARNAAEAYLVVSGIGVKMK